MLATHPKLPTQNPPDQITVNTIKKTLKLETTPGHWTEIPLPFRPGTFEHLSSQELKEAALFIQLKSLRSEDTKRRYLNEMEKFLFWVKWSGHTALNEWVILDYQQALISPSPELQQNTLVSFKPVSPETCDQYVNVVRSFLTQLHNKGLLNYNPGKHVPRLGIKQQSALKNSKHFTTDQWKVVLATLEALPEETLGQRNRRAQLRFCLLFAYAMGLRIKEHASHSHQHIVQYKGAWVLNVIGKGLRARRLTLDDFALDVLSEYRSFLKLPYFPNNESLPLLPTRKPVIIKTRGPNKGTVINAKAISKQVWEEHFKNFLKNDVMQYLAPDNPDLQKQVFDNEWFHLTPHSLRHTRITHLVEQGKDLLWVQKFAGHEKLDTTRHYFNVET